MTAAFLQKVEAAVKSGLTVSQIERQYGFPNRAIRRAKAELYRSGTLPQPKGCMPKESHAIEYR